MFYQFCKTEIPNTSNSMSNIAEILNYLLYFYSFHIIPELSKFQKLYIFIQYIKSFNHLVALEKAAKEFLKY